MRAWILLALATACGGGGDSSQLPPTPDCLTEAERGVNTCSVSIHAEVLQFETQTATTHPVSLRYDTAWDVPQKFALQCTPIATAQANSTTSFTADFDDVMCTSPGPGIVSIIAEDAPGPADQLALSLNDRRLPAGCPTLADCRLDPFRVWVVDEATWQSWKQGIPGFAWSRYGVAVLTYRDAQGNPVAGVTPEIVGGEEERRAAIPGEEVFFLSADRKTIAAGSTTTTASGAAVFPLVAGLSKFIGGAHPSIQFEFRIGLATGANAVFFEQIDPAP